MRKTIIILLTVSLTGLFIFTLFYLNQRLAGKSAPLAIPELLVKDRIITHPLQITEMRKKNYPGSDLTIEETLPDGAGYKRYVASYMSDNLKIKGLLAVPVSAPPSGGYPAIIFNHGYIQPETYKREVKYRDYISAFVRNGFIVFMPDYRGNQDSEGIPLGAYFSPAYTEDALNAFYSLAKYKDVNKDKMGMWGHSMGGHITLRSMVVSKDIKAGVIWGGVVASYQDMALNWRRTTTWRPSKRENMAGRPSRDDLIKEYGNFDENTDFWKSISPIYFVKDISGPVQLHHGLADNDVPWEFSQNLKDALDLAGKPVELYVYEGGDHNLSGSVFATAMNRSIEFFKKYLQ